MTTFDFIGIPLFLVLFNLLRIALLRKLQLQTTISLASLAHGLLAFITSITVSRLIFPEAVNNSPSIIPEVILVPFIGISIAVSCVWILSEYHIKSTWTKVTKETKWPMWFKIIVLILVGFSTFLISFSTWFRLYFGQLTPEQFLFNLQSPVTGTAGGISTSIVYNPGFVTLAVLLITSLLLFSKHVYKRSEKPIRFKKRTASILSIFALIGGVGYTVWLLQLDQVVKTYFSSSTYIQDNYVDVRNTNPVFPDKKRNLVHIYMESVESSYFDKENGGYMAQNLMPELLQLSKEGVHFSHNDKMGGPHQTYGSSWSVASMVNMMSGIPLKVAMDGNDYGKSGYFLPGIYNLGDLLGDNGYEQTIMFGADADFGGLTVYFTDHGNFNIFDHKHAKKVGLIPQDYNVWWGFEDDKLYEYAKTEMTRLSQTGKPFHFSMENADTHFPHGYMTPNTPVIYEKQYANVIAHSQKQVVDLVRWIQEQPFYDNTTIVITGDHLSMDAEFFQDFDPKYERTVFNVILNAPIQATHTTNRHFSPLDFYPTIVASLGIAFDGERLGLGTNLFSSEQTLIERDSLQVFNDQLGRNSNFYNEQFVSHKKKH